MGYAIIEMGNQKIKKFIQSNTRLMADQKLVLVSVSNVIHNTIDLLPPIFIPNQTEFQFDYANSTFIFKYRLLINDVNENPLQITEVVLRYIYGNYRKTTSWEKIQINSYVRNEAHYTGDMIPATEIDPNYLAITKANIFAGNYLIGSKDRNLDIEFLKIWQDVIIHIVSCVMYYPHIQTTESAEHLKILVDGWIEFVKEHVDVVDVHKVLYYLIKTITDFGDWGVPLLEKSIMLQSSDLKIGQKYLYTESEDKNVHLVEVKKTNSTTIEFVILKSKLFETGYIFWLAARHIDEMLIPKGRLVPAPETETVPTEPEVSNTNPPEGIEEPKVKRKESTIFTPFKFWNSENKQVCLGCVVEIKTIETALKKQTIFTVRETAPDTMRWFEYSYNQEQFENLKPIFFEDFEYPIPQEEKKDESAPSGT